MQFDQAIDIPDVLLRDDLGVALLCERLRYSLRIKSADVAAFKKMTALKLPSKINSSTRSSKEICIKFGPDEWLVITDPARAKALGKAFEKASKEFVYSVTEVSHRNVAFTVSGERAAQLINVGCPLDLSLDAFPVGKVTRTVFESAQIVLLRSDETEFHIECWRSFGPYLRDFFTRFVTARL